MKGSLLVIYGINPVREAIPTGAVATLYMSGRNDARASEILRLAAIRGISVERTDKTTLTKMSGGGVHQGVVAELDVAHECLVTDLIDGTLSVPLLVVLDGIQDPQNFGAILRTVDAVGADGVIYQKRRAAPLSGVTARTSAGAIVHTKRASVVNIVYALEELKRAGIWTVGLAGGAPKRYDTIDLTQPTAFVVGAEGVGLRRLVRERCDWLVSIPMRGHVGSLNVSVATGVALFEAVRQRKSTT